MLLSPGHSPRHLSSPSPAAQTPFSAAGGDSAVIAPVPATARASRPRRPRVLDEDSYVTAIAKIIERDYFPDIPRLRDHLDWLEAVSSGDAVQIRDAQLKIIERRRGTPLGGTAAAGTSTQPRIQTLTPGSTFARKSSFTPFGFEDHTENFDERTTRRTPRVGRDKDGEGSVDGNDGEGEAVDVSLSLDEFFRRYTSEDNESFSKILEKVNRKRKEMYGYLLAGEKEGDVKLIADAKRERVATDGFGSSDQPVSTLQGWKYTAKNLLMYHPADKGEVLLTEVEMAERLKGLTKEINKTNTRFRGEMVDYKAKEDDTVEVLYTPVAGATPVLVTGRDQDKGKRYDLEDLRKTPNPLYVDLGKKAENGYSFVRTPSPAPGVDESPFITWGEIDGTPLRLEPEETPIDIGGSGKGPQFKIPPPPSRDVKAHSLSREAARKLRERAKMFQKPPLHSPIRRGSASPGARTLSPAAQDLFRKAIAKSSHGLDESLRASYRGASPGMSTPKTRRSSSRLGRDSSAFWSPLRDDSNR